MAAVVEWRVESGSKEIPESYSRIRYKRIRAAVHPEPEHQVRNEVIAGNLIAAELSPSEASGFGDGIVLGERAG